ncbi:MAG: hypothetical protein IPJ60_03165 [Sphingobacteriaceae bacterium]|nr:hypothetical protein [Sphingobacteriaceae bacterium]
MNFGNFENLMKRVTVSGAYIIAGVNTSGGARIVRMPLSSIGLTTGINELAAGTLENKVYPNPTSDNVTIEVSDLTFDDNCIVKLYLVLIQRSLKTKIPDDNVGDFFITEYLFVLIYDIDLFVEHSFTFHNY